MSSDRCIYCHGENGVHACNCWDPSKAPARPTPSPLAGADIVERLRKRGGDEFILLDEAADEIEWTRWQVDYHSQCRVYDADTIRDLEQEIRRLLAYQKTLDDIINGLRRENKRLQERVMEAENRQGLASVECAQLRAENERLREAMLKSLNKMDRIEKNRVLSAALSQKEGE